LGFNSVVGLLRIKGPAVPAAKIRTVGLTEALARAARFVKSKADGKDLQLLIDRRNGVVHAAEDTEVEERMLAAFAKHADAFLEELGRDRASFWGGQLPVVSELVRDVSDKVTHRLRVKLASAEARFEDRRASEGDDVIRALQALSKTAPLAVNQTRYECPACLSSGIATGVHAVEYDVADWDKDTGVVTSVVPVVMFSAEAFRCPICGLRFDSQTEVEACFESVWVIKDADWRDYEPDYELPENWRDYVELDEAPEDGEGREDTD
jgi:hypothetical protein